MRSFWSCVSPLPSWNPPPTGICKLNFDGSTIGNPGLAGIGGIIQESSGSISGPIGVCIVNKPEMEAMQIGLREACRLNLRGIIGL